MCAYEHIAYIYEVVFAHTCASRLVLFENYFNSFLFPLRTIPLFFIQVAMLVRAPIHMKGPRLQTAWSSPTSWWHSVRELQAFPDCLCVVVWYLSLLLIEIVPPS